MVVLEAALRQPDRFEGLAIVCGRTSGKLTPGSQAMLIGCQNDFAATMGAFCKACTPEPDCAAEREFGRRIVMRSDAKSAVELMTCMEGIEFGDRFGAFAMPVLVLQGARDVISPPAGAEAMARALPNARLVMHPEAGHVPTLTRPDWVAREMRGFFA
jgi:pimeloyl-ACP methyl ester carboxylesterase